MKRNKNLRKHHLFTFIFLATAITMTASLLAIQLKKEKPDLAMVNIDTTLSILAQTNIVNVRLEEQGYRLMAPGKECLPIFEQTEWKKTTEEAAGRRVLLKITIQSDYYIQFYGDDLARVYCGFSKEPYRYYAVPPGVYSALRTYILAYGIPDDPDEIVTSTLYNVPTHSINPITFCKYP